MEPSLRCTLQYSVLPTGYWEPPPKRCCCARRGPQLVLVGLLSTAMWAGVLTLLLLWRTDIPSPHSAPTTERSAPIPMPGKPSTLFRTLSPHLLFPLNVPVPQHPWFTCTPNPSRQMWGDK